ncbi:MAG TPA: hypothetical protein VFW73_11450 [Lacipirellulaceae bacterium]|nr:hypothetical protein [Lacipirellulaceae bacterium]
MAAAVVAAAVVVVEAAASRVVEAHGLAVVVEVCEVAVPHRAPLHYRDPPFQQILVAGRPAVRLAEVASPVPGPRWATCPRRVIDRTQLAIVLEAAIWRTGRTSALGPVLVRAPLRAHALALADAHRLVTFRTFSIYPILEVVAALRPFHPRASEMQAQTLVVR